MLRSNASLFRRLMMLVDGLLLVAAYALGEQLAGGVDGTRSQQLVLLVGSVPIWIALLAAAGAYQSLRETASSAIVWVTVKAVAMFMAAQLAVLYLTGWDLSREFVFFYPGIAGGLVGLTRTVVFGALSRIRRSGMNTRAVVIVGVDAAAAEYAGVVLGHLQWGLCIAGFFNYDDQPAEAPVAGIPVLGPAGDLGRYLLANPVDRVVFSVPLDGRMDRVADALALCREMGVEVVMLPMLAVLPGAKIHVEQFFGLPLVHYTRTPQQVGALILKQAMDVALSALALICLLPLFAVVAALIKLDSPGPVFFGQSRAGLHGRRFRCLKFRTMHVDAEARLAELRHLNEMDGPVFKIRNDPRITRVGRVLRKFSLDELPQFWNVVAGDMSLVGPRPPLPSEVAQYTPAQRRRLSVKPGLTCIWQVSGRNHLDFENWVRLDLEYIDRWTLGLDLLLLIKTLSVVLRGTGM